MTAHKDGEYLGPNRFGDLIESHMDESLENSLVASRPIPKNTLVIVFGGHVMNQKTYSSLPIYPRDLALQIDDDFFLGIREESEWNIAEGVNHSCDPTCGILGSRYLVSLRDIDKGEHITFDYAMTDTSGPGGIECLCGTDRCRSILTYEDWKIPELQERYGWFFSEYLLRKIRNEPNLRFDERKMNTDKHLFSSYLPLDKPEAYFTK
jgi:hypothetical protein